MMPKRLLLALLGGSALSCASFPPPRAPRDLTAAGAQPRPELVLQTGHKDFVLESAFSGDGRLLATWSSGDRVRMWNVSLGAELRTMGAADHCLALDQEGRVLASGGPDTPVTLRDTATGEELGKIGPAAWIEAIAFARGDRIVIGSEGKVGIWDLRTGARAATLATAGTIQKLEVRGEVAIVEEYGDDHTLLAFALEDGRELLRVQGQSTWAVDPAGTLLARASFYRDDAEGGHAIELRELRDPSAAPRRIIHDDFIGELAVRADGTIAVTNQTGTGGAIIDIASGKLVKKVVHPEVRWKDGTPPKRFSPDGRWLLRDDLNGLLVTGADTGEVVSSLIGDLRPSGGIAFASDGSGLLLERRLSGPDEAGSVAVLDLRDGKMSPLFRPEATERAAWKARGRGALLREGLRRLEKGPAATGPQTCPGDPWYAKVPNRGDVGWMADVGKPVVACDLRTGAELARLECESCYAIGFAPDGRLFLLQTGRGIDLVDAQGRRSPFLDAATVTGGVLAVALSPDGRTTAFADWQSQTLVLYDVEKKVKLAELPGVAAAVEPSSIAFDTTGTMLAVRDEVGRVLLFDVPSRKLIAHLFLLGEEDWVLISADGRYDGNDGGMRKVKYVAGLEVIPLDGLFERFYSPRLARQLLARGAEGEKERSAAAVAQLEIRPPPRVRIVSPANGAELQSDQLEVKVEAQDQGAGVEEIRLYVDGKLLEGDGRGLKKAGVSRTFTVSLAPGTTELKAIAVDTARSESAPAVITVTRAGARRDARLFLLVAGVNEYKNPRYSLGYAKLDAQSFAGSLERHASAIFAGVVRHHLYDAEVTRAGLEAAFAKVSAEAQPQDVFVFYFAGHGVMSEGTPPEAPDFFLAPHDVVKLYGDDAGLARAGLSSRRLRELVTAVRAQKQLLIFDACQSGGAVDTFAHRGAVEEKAILQLSRSVGVTVLAATGTEQLATEFKEIGHGVFTFALLSGLDGAADGTPADGKITVRELTAYIEDQVPELTKKYRGTAQYPQSFSRGQDFPLGTK